MYIYVRTKYEVVKSITAYMYLHLPTLAALVTCM